MMDPRRGDPIDIVQESPPAAASSQGRPAPNRQCRIDTKRSLAYAPWASRPPFLAQRPGGRGSTVAGNMLFTLASTADRSVRPAWARVGPSSKAGGGAHAWPPPFPGTPRQLSAAGEPQGPREGISTAVHCLLSALRQPRQEGPSGPGSGRERDGLPLCEFVAHF